MTVRLRISTNRGLEDLVVQELAGRAAAASLGGVTGICSPEGLRGWAEVVVEAPTAEVQALALTLRSAHHVVRVVHTFELEAADPLGQIAREIASLDVPELRPPGVTFRATSRRHGTHRFTSEDVQRVAGAGVRRRAWRAVSLGDYDVNLRVDVHDDRCLVGVQLTREPLSRRHARPFLPHMTLHANVAWALLQLARPEAGTPATAVLDPFCGGGTLLLEAAARWPNASLSGSDTSAECVEGTRANLAAALASGDIRQGDARDVEQIWAGARFDTVVSNPPFGKRIGPNMSFEGLFGDLLSGLLPVTGVGARIALLVFKRGAFNRALRGRPELRLRHARVIELGGLHPCIMVLDRIA